MYAENEVARDSEPGLVGTMLNFLRNDIAEIQLAAEHLRGTTDGLFGALPTEGGASGTNTTPLCAASELQDLMEAAIAARRDLHGEVNRLTGQL